MSPETWLFLLYDLYPFNAWVICFVLAWVSITINAFSEPKGVQRGWADIHFPCEKEIPGITCYCYYCEKARRGR